MGSAILKLVNWKCVELAKNGISRGKVNYFQANSKKLNSHQWKFLSETPVYLQMAFDSWLNRAYPGWKFRLRTGNSQSFKIFIPCPPRINQIFGADGPVFIHCLLMERNTKLDPKTHPISLGMNSLLINFVFLDWFLILSLCWKKKKWDEMVTPVTRSNELGWREERESQNKVYARYANISFQ